MTWISLASVDDVRFAGNISEKVEEQTIRFYLQLASYFMYAMIGSDNYVDALKGTGSCIPPVDDMLKKAEALVAVSFALPSVSLHLSEMGAVKQMAMARGGEYQAMSYAKEIQEMAASYMTLARVLIPDSLIISENYAAIWSHVAMVVFPSLDEYPTRATIHSWAETLLQEARGDEVYDGTREGVD